MDEYCVTRWFERYGEQVVMDTYFGDKLAHNVLAARNLHIRMADSISLDLLALTIRRYHNPKHRLLWHEWLIP